VVLELWPQDDLYFFKVHPFCPMINEYRPLLPYDVPCSFDAHFYARADEMTGRHRYLH